MTKVYRLIIYLVSILYVSGQLKPIFDPVVTATGMLLPNTKNNTNLSEMINELNTLKSTYSDSPVRALPLGFKSNVKISSIAEAKKFAKFSGASYCSDITLATWKCFHCKQLGTNIKIISILKDVITGMSAYIAIDSGNKQIILAFRGSYNARNWLTDFNFPMVDFTLEGGSDIKVHFGFKLAMDNLSLQYTLIVRELLTKYPEHKVVSVGHSLGGAVANLAFLDLQRSQRLSWDKIQLFTYGAPRIGNAAFALWVNSKPASITRVTNDKDIVPHIPFRKWGYSHNQLEMFIQNNQVRVCDNTVIEDPACSLSIEPFVNPVDHIFYFDTSFGIPC